MIIIIAAHWGFSCGNFYADTIWKLFSEIKFFEKGTNEHENEERAYKYFVDYLEDCERGMYS